MKKIISFILALMILVPATMIPIFAESTPVADTSITVGDFEAEIVGEEQVIITAYKGYNEQVTIPAELGYKVVGIAEDAFRSNSLVRKVIISEGIEEIGDNAFAFCRKLTSVTLPSTLTTLGDGAFLYCYNLGSITVPSNTLTIGEMAFGYNRRTLDLETLTYTYKPDPTFTVYAEQGCAAYDFAISCNFELNKDEMFNDFASGIDFEIPYQWTNFKRIFCHIWDMASGEVFATWQSKREECTVYYDHVEYNPDIIGGLNPDTVYGVIFSADTGEQTFPAIFTFDCLGDILYTDNTYVYTPEGTEPRLMAKWRLGDMSKYERAFGLYDNSSFDIPEIVTPDEATPDALPWGDANCDKKLNVKDATAIQKHLADITTLSDTGLMLGKFISKTQPLSIRNATEIQKYCAGLRAVERLGTPAVTQVVVERPQSWYRQEMQAMSWSSPDEVMILPDSSGFIQNEYHAIFLVPVYHQNIVITCNGTTTKAMVVDFYGGDNNGANKYIGEYFGTDDDGNIQFIWTTFA
ncbi:MAG: leucine-rich repeat protein [Ruminococcus sp.]|nr:leucine-rich repeat protein [Ruminococcus sp.]